MRLLAALLIVVALAVPVTWSGELAGVSFPDEVTVDDATLVLNGIGLRKKFVVKVYVAGLYLSKKTDDADAALGADGPKRVVMKFMTNKATKKKMDAAWRDGFEANSPEEFGALEKRVNTFAGFFGDMKDGDVIGMTIIPGQGTAVTYNGRDKGVIEGDDFSSALLKVWLGDHPPTDDLKTGMLGG
jgi:hypothetical protein